MAKPKTIKKVENEMPIGSVTYKQFSDAFQSWKALTEHKFGKGTFAYKFAMKTATINDAFDVYSAEVDALVEKYAKKDAQFASARTFQDASVREEYKAEQAKFLKKTMVIEGDKFVFTNHNFPKNFFSANDFRVLSPFIEFVVEGDQD